MLAFHNFRKFCFNPLPSCEGRHFFRLEWVKPRQFQSTPLMRGETVQWAVQEPTVFVSIHSPHARGDDHRASSSRLQWGFNPLPSCEGRPAAAAAAAAGTGFNPLPSCEGRQFSPPMITLWRCFNPLPSCEGRPRARPLMLTLEDVSIHSPHARGDQIMQPKADYFDVSIHSPHARGDIYFLPTYLL